MFWCAIDLLPLSVLPNLRWLVPLCLDDDLRFPIEVNDVCDAETTGAPAREKRGPCELA